MTPRKKLWKLEAAPFIARRQTLSGQAIAHIIQRINMTDCVCILESFVRNAPRASGGHPNQAHEKRTRNYPTSSAHGQFFDSNTDMHHVLSILQGHDAILLIPLKSVVT